MPAVTAGPIYPAVVLNPDGTRRHNTVKLARIGDTVYAWGYASEYPDGQPTSTRAVALAECWEHADLVGAETSDGVAFRIVPFDPDGETLDVQATGGCRGCGPLAKFQPSL